LTEQERLLLRIVHRGDPVELAMLDPMQRAARNVEEQAEFQRFFGEARSAANGGRIEDRAASRRTINDGAAKDGTDTDRTIENGR